MKKAKSKTTNPKAKSAKPKKSHASFYDRNELSKVLGIDGRTVNRRCSRLGISPEPAKPNKPIQYRLTSAQFESLRKPLRRNSSFLGDGSDLRQSKLAEEIELLRLKNKKLRHETTSNHVLAEILGGLASSTAGLIRQKLEIEFPVMCAGLSEDEIRKHTAELVAVIVSKWDGEAAKWAKYAATAQG